MAYDFLPRDPRVRAIFEAVFAADIEGLRQALARGGDPNVSDRSIGAPLHRAAQPQSATGRNVPSTAAQLTLLLTAGAEVERPGAYGQTALYMVDDLAAARVLVDAGADVNAWTPTGETPIMNKRSADTMAFLLDRGADLDARDEIGQTALSRRSETARGRSYDCSSIAARIPTPRIGTGSARGISRAAIRSLPRC